MLPIGRSWEVIRIASRLPSKSYRDHHRLALRSLKNYKSHEQMEQYSLILNVMNYKKQISWDCFKF
jgi:hypothetical protein